MSRAAAKSELLDPPRRRVKKCQSGPLGLKIARKSSSWKSVAASATSRPSSEHEPAQEVEAVLGRGGHASASEAS